jgi:hypothetical protein
MRRSSTLGSLYKKPSGAPYSAAALCNAQPHETSQLSTASSVIMHPLVGQKRALSPDPTSYAGGKKRASEEDSTNPEFLALSPTDTHMDSDGMIRGTGDR